MSILRKRSCAVVIALVVVCLSTLLSVNRSLGSAADRVADGFYSGVKYDGYVHKSIYSQLEQRSGAAAGLVTIGANYVALGDVTEALRSARQELANTMDGGDVAAMYKANTALQTAYEAFVYAAQNAGLSTRDQKGVDSYADTLSGAQNVIAAAGYNESVREFERKTLSRFPAGLLAPIAGVDAPVLFE